MSNVENVVKWRLCVGCGVCAHVCPEKKILLEDVINDGVRPRVKEGNCADCDLCVKVCPGLEISHRSSVNGRGIDEGLFSGWGPVREIWEGYANDPEIRFSGSSGGVASALALYCVEKGDAGSLLHVGPDEANPLGNAAYTSRNRKEILARTGSRYSPASPCTGLNKVENEAAPYVFIGKPCDIEGLRKTQELGIGLPRELSTAISIFCAGTPATRGTLDLLATLGVPAPLVAEIRYRGRGWPGKFTVRQSGERQPAVTVPYGDSWGFIQKYRPLRCYLCPDGTGESADISCGDPWYRVIREGERGHSLCLVRTDRGAEVVRGAIKAGYVSLKRVEGEMLEKSQSNLLDKRRAIWGRILAMRLLGLPAPKFSGFYLFENWRELSLKDKMRSIFGTARRILRRRYYRPLSRGSARPGAREVLE